MIARSGGAPPEIFWLRNDATSSPADVYVVFAPVFFENASRTFMKFACSVPDHFATTSTLWPARLVELLEVPVVLVLPQPAVASATTASRKTNRVLRVMYSSSLGVPGAWRLGAPPGARFVTGRGPRPAR